ncbi:MULTISPECIES: ParA family protein [Anoxybacillus]|uniref:ParA family protein n=1 Tax=Anoxybacillus TaxID=150247 RepID=UPI000542112F|nr:MULTISPECIES: AAA family ATPase [Anoxybacillus]KHF26751.1 CobQ/CobB/MinD/ParA nucleotide binding domain protein [Anoxybacillus sp. BCO1]
MDNIQIFHQQHALPSQPINHHDIAIEKIRHNLSLFLIQLSLLWLKPRDSCAVTSNDEYDFIFIDCPPNLNYITQNALYASNYYLIPAIPDRLSSYGISAIKNKVDELNERFQSSSKEYSDTKLIGIVLNFILEYGNQPKHTQTNMINTLKHTLSPDVNDPTTKVVGLQLSRSASGRCPPSFI